MSGETRPLDNIRRRYARAITEAVGSGGGSIEAAFGRIPREDFLPPPPWVLYGSAIAGRIVTSDPAELYCDGLAAIDEQRGINNGQPSLHAAWIAAADPKPGEIVVHVGCGGGYYSAILADLVGPNGHVHAYEIDPEVADLAKQALAPYGNVTLYPFSGAGGVLPAADVIYVNAAATAPQSGWLDALRPGGRLVFPWEFSLRGTAAMIVTRTATPSAESDLPVFAARAIGRVSFIAMEAEAEHRKASASPAAVLEIASLLPKAAFQPDTTMVAEFDSYWFSIASYEKMDPVFRK